MHTEQFLDMVYANAYIPIINRPIRITKEISSLNNNISTKIMISAIAFTLVFYKQIYQIIISCFIILKLIVSTVKKLVQSCKNH